MSLFNGSKIVYNVNSFFMDLLRFLCLRNKIFLRGISIGNQNRNDHKLLTSTTVSTDKNVLGLVDYWYKNLMLVYCEFLFLGIKFYIWIVVLRLINKIMV